MVCGSCESIVPFFFLVVNSGSGIPPSFRFFFRRLPFLVLSNSGGQERNFFQKGIAKRKKMWYNIRQCKTKRKGVCRWGAKAAGSRRTASTRTPCSPGCSGTRPSWPRGCTTFCGITSHICSLESVLIMFTAYFATKLRLCSILYSKGYMGRCEFF